MRYIFTHNNQRQTEHTQLIGTEAYGFKRWVFSTRVLLKKSIPLFSSDILLCSALFEREMCVCFAKLPNLGWYQIICKGISERRREMMCSIVNYYMELRSAMKTLLWGEKNVCYCHSWKNRIKISFVLIKGLPHRAVCSDVSIKLNCFDYHQSSLTHSLCGQTHNIDDERVEFIVDAWCKWIKGNMHSSS